MGLGMSFGPVFGSLFYITTGYTGTFCIFAIIIALNCFIVSMVIPE
jgi:hypothetical protein